MFARLLSRRPLLILCAATVFLSTAFAISQSPAKAGISVKVTGIRGTQGNILVVLRSGPGHVVQSQKADIDTKTMTASASFAQVPPGTYDIAVIHDENGNGHLDFNEVGMPVEGYGHSNNPAQRPGEPPFDETKFTLGASNLSFDISLIYWP